MNDGLWRVGSLTVPTALVAALVLGIAACSSGPGPAGVDTAATVIGDSTPDSTDPEPSDPSVDDKPALTADGATAEDSIATSATGSESPHGDAGTTTLANSAAPTSTPAATTPSATAPATTTPSATAAPTIGPGSGGVDTSQADGVIGTGTPASCTSQAVVDAVAAGGVITFDCGPAPVIIAMDATAKVVNGNGPEIVLDGGGLITLDGQGRHRILYMNTCDQAQGWTTSHCQNQDHPRLTVQNLTFVNGNATGSNEEGGGGGAIFVRGGRFAVHNSTFADNRCDDTGPDVGGAAIRVLSQYQGLPVTVTGSTFRDGVCSNGGALSSIGVSWVVSDSVMTGNRAIGRGANPAQAGTPGGGSGGAIYLDGNTFALELRNTRIEGNHANEGGGAVFFVSNDRTGSMSITGSNLVGNPSDGFETQGFPGIFFLGSGSPSVSGSTLS